MLRFFSPRLIRIEERPATSHTLTQASGNLPNRFDAMENEAINVAGLTTPESSRVADERSPAPPTDDTLIEETTETDTDTDVDIEEVTRARSSLHSTLSNPRINPHSSSQNTCKNCQHKRCILDRRIATVVKSVVRECARVTLAADDFSDAVEQKVDAVVAGSDAVGDALGDVNAAVINLQTKLNAANHARAWLEGDVEALRAELQRPGVGNGSVVGVGVRKRKMGEEGSPVPEVVVNGGGGRVGRGLARKLSKVSNGLPSRHATPSQCARE